MQNSRLIGRDGEMNQLMDLVSSARDRHHVLSVWGFPGVGKSALVKTFLYQRAVDKMLPFHWYSWAHVSHPFNLGDFCYRMLSSHSELDHTSYSEQDNMYKCESAQQDRDIKECKNFLKDRKCLVVIDGLRSKEDWDMMSNLINDESRGCFIVITREEIIAKYCATSDNSVYKVKALESEAALQYFKQVRRI